MAAPARHTPDPGSFLPVSLATLDTRLPQGAAWVHEAKLDGYRIEAIVHRQRVQLFSRNARDWTDRFPAIAAALRTLPVNSVVLDGEIIAVPPRGHSAFQALQRALRPTPHDAAQQLLRYVVFDLLVLDGTDVRDYPLVERQQLLHALMRLRHAALPLRVVRRFGERDIADRAQHPANHPASHPLARACAAGLEGLVSKRLDQRYLSGRHRGWIKVKCGRRQEFVIVGYTEPQGSRTGFGALLLAVHDAHGALQYAGKVGTGFDTAGLLALGRQLKALERPTSPLTPPPTAGVRASIRGAHWVKPTLVAEISFTEWTVDGRLRHPVFHGIRDDKTAREVTREDPR